MSRIFITTISILLSVRLFAMQNIDVMQINNNEQSLKQQTTPVMVCNFISEDRKDNSISIKDNLQEDNERNNIQSIVHSFNDMSHKMDLLLELVQNKTLTANQAVVPMNEEDKIQTISVNEPVMNSNLKGAKEDIENVVATSKEFFGKGKEFFAGIRNFFNNFCCKKKVTEESIKNDISKLENKVATGRFLLENFQRSQIIE